MNNDNQMVPGWKGRRDEEPERTAMSSEMDSMKQQPKVSSKDKWLRHLFYLRVICQNYIINKSHVILSCRIESFNLFLV